MPSSRGIQAVSGPDRKKRRREKRVVVLPAMLLSLHNQVDEHQVRFLVIVLILQPVVSHCLNRFLSDSPKKLVTTGYLAAFCWLVAFVVTESRLSVAEFAGNKWFPDSIPAKVNNLQLLMRPLQYWFYSNNATSRLNDYAIVLVIGINTLILLSALAIGWISDFKMRTSLLWGACILVFLLDGVDLGRDCLASVICGLFALRESWRVRFFCSLACLVVLSAAEAGYYRSFVGNQLRKEDTVVHVHMLVSMVLPAAASVFSFFLVRREASEKTEEEDEQERRSLITL